MTKTSEASVDAGLREMLRAMAGLLREHIGETRLREGCPCACCRSIAFLERPDVVGALASNPGERT